MRKIVRTNNAAAIAISAAIGSLDTENSHSAVNPASDVVANPSESDVPSPSIVPASADTYHFDISDFSNGDSQFQLGQTTNTEHLSATDFAPGNAGVLPSS